MDSWVFTISFKHIRFLVSCSRLSSFLWAFDCMLISHYHSFIMWMYTCCTVLILLEWRTNHKSQFHTHDIFKYQIYWKACHFSTQLLSNACIALIWPYANTLVKIHCKQHKLPTFKLEKFKKTYCCGRRQIFHKTIHDNILVSRSFYVPPGECMWISHRYCHRRCLAIYCT